MLRALAQFEASIGESKRFTELYDFLVNSVRSPFSYEDLLRSQIVYAVSAFDKLIHDLIRIGMVATYLGNRSPTPKYLAESISISLHGQLLSASLPPKQVLFEQEIARKLSFVSYQDPDNVSDGLAYIWDRKHKWAVIASEMDWNVDDVKTQVKLIANRRNSIVHEFDMSPLTDTRTQITRTEVAGVTDFLDTCGKAIAKLVL